MSVFEIVVIRTAILWFLNYYMFPIYITGRIWKVPLFTKLIGNFILFIRSRFFTVNWTQHFNKRCLIKSCLIMQETVLLLIRNWKLRDLNLSPVAKNRNVRGNVAGAVMTLFPPFTWYGVMCCSILFNSFLKSS